MSLAKLSPLATLERAVLLDAEFANVPGMLNPRPSADGLKGDKLIMLDFLQQTREALDVQLFQLGNNSISTVTLATVLVIIIFTFWFSRIARSLVTRAMYARGAHPGAVGTITGLLHYFVLFSGIGTAFGTAGIDLTALFAAGAFFAVGLGFAMQSIAQNFVAGLILLIERAIKPGDILEVEGVLVKVLEMGVRASVVQARDGEDVIIPNSVLIQTSVTNYTLRDSIYRARITVGVSYNSDMRQVRASLEELATTMTDRWGIPGRSPQVTLAGFGASSVDWELAIWIPDPWELRAAASEIREAMWWRFKKDAIVIAFPQVDVHLDQPVMASLKGLSAA